ncbi:MAG TPA: hypothetical protein VIM98_00970 [Dyella sp.]|uniref:hypothetical protein n=1 Tax=Dyella sp. TaxID=1869338 RepID=UPI002F939117
MAPVTDKREQKRERREFQGGRSRGRIAAAAFSVCLICVLWVPGWASAAATYRIGHRVLTAGDDAARVRALLGAPIAISGTVHRGPIDRRSPRRHRGGKDRHGPQARRATQWHYRVGRGSVRVTLVAGKVVDIATER